MSQAKKRKPGEPAGLILPVNQVLATGMAEIERKFGPDAMLAASCLAVRVHGDTMLDLMFSGRPKHAQDHWRWN